jgi:hypothetical protein
VGRMTTARSLSRLVAVLLPFLVVAGCMRVASVEPDTPPPLSVGEIGVPERPAPPATRGERAEGREVPMQLPGRPPEEVVAAPQAEVQDRPAWLGTRPIDITAPILPTPPELVDRRFPPPDPLLPAPPDEAFHWRAGRVPADVAARSTWRKGCPAHLDDLRYITVSHWGFDGEVHTGELIVHKSATKAMVQVFGRLHEIRYPIEELRVISMADMDAEPTGDGNVSAAFACRKKVSGRSWSEHSYGKAIDLNPFQNPYLKGQLVVPQLAAAYLDRGHHRPGMIQPGDEVVRAFAAIGWQWGGDWTSAKDWMHFSVNGR